MTPAVCAPVLQHLKTKTSSIHLYKIKHLKSINVNIIVLAVMIVVFWGPYGGGGVKRMDETHLSALPSTSNHAHGKRSKAVSLPHFIFFMQETVRRSRYTI